MAAVESVSDSEGLKVIQYLYNNHTHVIYCKGNAVFDSFTDSNLI